EAEELVKSLNSSVTSMKDKPFQIGVVYTSWTVDELLNPASDITLAKLKQNGFDTIAIMVPTYQDTIESDNVFANDGPGGDTPSVESLKHAVEICHKIGLRVVLKMHVDPRTDEARINILPSEPWFKSYEAMVMKYAVFAQQSGVDAFSVGTELEGTTFGPWLDKWKEIIKKIRGVYKGLLTYSANWTEYQGVNFWNELDYIGIDAYFPITSKNDPTPDELIAGWNKVADEIETWLKAQNLTDKGVVFTEVGYTSTNGTNRQPWVAVTNTEDQQEQADCLEATFSVFSKRPWFKGYNLWQYMPQERWSPLGFTVNGKKAEEVVKKWNSAFAGKK
ncbi:MAG TPA: glycoside hydrolase TIM-barrel-like domain-containing protein, partial [Candidatus Omnitrophota bacterium]|nr:glycoside hydrolase TIM-barrel-like domain-containing protein [Candidatus Omnitrophota bacterium]